MPTSCKEKVLSLSGGQIHTTAADLTLGIGEVRHSGVMENVDLLNARDGIHSKPLEGILQPLVVC